MTADPYAPARRATNGGHGCVVPERIQPRRVFVAEEFAEFNEGTRRARTEHAAHPIAACKRSWCDDLRDTDTHYCPRCRDQADANNADRRKATP